MFEQACRTQGRKTCISCLPGDTQNAGLKGKQKPFKGTLLLYLEQMGNKQFRGKSENLDSQLEDPSTVESPAMGIFISDDMCDSL